MDWLYHFRTLEVVVTLISSFRVLSAFGSEFHQYRTTYYYTKEAAKFLLSVLAAIAVLELVIWQVVYD